MSFTAAAVAARWARRAGLVNPEVRRTMRALSRRVLSVSLKHMDADIYSKPIDRSGTGREKWKRTQRLRDAERVEMHADGAGFTLKNDLAYAEPRHEAGKPGRRNTKRPAHWRDEMKTELAHEIRLAIGAMNDRIIAGR